MPDFVFYVVAVVLAYLLGSIPMGLLVVRVLTGEDVRTIGSGRTGGTNALRAAGIKGGIITGVLDLGKGFLAVMLARWLAPGLPWIEAAAAIAVVAGHNWSIYINFKGGAGTQPNVGAAIALWPPVGIALVPLVIFTLWSTGYASVASSVGCFAVMVVFIVRAALGLDPLPYAVYATITMAFVAIALIPNYKRLIDGTERVVGPRAKRIAERNSSS